MMTKDEALKMAIEALETNVPYYVLDRGYAPLIACKEALEQPAQAITEGSQLSNIKVGSKSEKPSPPLAPKHTCAYSRTMNQEYPRKCIHCGEVEAPAKCEAKQYSDQMQCSKCNLSWDMNDPCSPDCAKIEQVCIPQEPVAKQYLVVDESDCYGDGSIYRGLRGKDSSIPTYRIEAHPAPSWQGLSDDEIGVLFDSVMDNDKVSTEFFGIEFARAIEQALKEKNL